jgi:NAD(P)-dependent dehydrogenase (short-subunit alcohol dehydrogenase family)
MAASLVTRVALVTGAGSGIGRACALALARAGAVVVAADIDRPAGEETVALVAAAGGTAWFVAADVTRDAEVAAMVGAVVARHGRLDHAVNNAGIPSNGKSITDCPEEDWDRLMAVNLKSVWLCLKHELRQMEAQGGGAIVNMASIAGLAGLARRGDYVAAKHGVVGLTRTAALECATAGIRVNAVCPGYVRTPMVERVIRREPEHEARMVAREPIGRLGTPEEVAAAVVWLCSDAASYVTGHALAVDGGFMAQ